MVFFRQDHLIVPLCFQFLVLFKIGFTKEFINILFHVLVPERESLQQANREDTEAVDVYPTDGQSCSVCKKPYDTTLFWCAACDSKRLQDNFPDWTSGRKELDQIIRETQLKSEGHTSYLEWIPYEKFTDIKKIGEGGFGTVYSATWIDGPKWKWDNEKNKWVSSGPRKIAFKTLKCATMSERRKKFREELECHSICVGIKRIVHCFGVTRDPKTGNYMMVTNFANEGDLASYIKKHRQKLTWNHIIRLSRDIAKALRELHRNNLVHRDLHGGNILNHVTSYGITWTWLADLGLCMREDVASQVVNDRKIYGKLGYVAPEVIRYKTYTKAADVYSFGIILWELTSCRTPFSNMSQDNPLTIPLTLGILGGRRPEIVEGTPKAFADLIRACWNQDPKLRPTMEEVYKRIWSFSNSMIKGNRKDLYGFKAAEESRALMLLSMENQTYPEILYLSGPELSSISSDRSLMNSCCIQEAKMESRTTDLEHEMETEKGRFLSLPIMANRTVLA